MTKKKRRGKGDRRPKKKPPVDPSGGGPAVDFAPLSGWMPRGPYPIRGGPNRGWSVVVTPEAPTALAVPVTIVSGHEVPRNDALRYLLAELRDDGCAYGHAFAKGACLCHGCVARELLESRIRC